MTIGDPEVLRGNTPKALIHQEKSIKKFQKYAKSAKSQNKILTGNGL